MSQRPNHVPPSALDAVGSIDSARLLARLLTGGFIAIIVALFVTPWQQSVTGTGRVIAYTPIERQQTVDSPITGRVVRWHVQEGDHIKAGEPLVDLGDNDPDIQARLMRERDAIQREIDAATLTIAVSETKIASREGVRTAAVMQADLKRQMSQDRKTAAERARDAAVATHQTAKQNAERLRGLHKKGLVSTRDLELAELKLQTASADLDRAKASLKAATREIKAMTAGREEKDADTNAKLAEARASLQKAKADKAKAERELAKIEVKLARQSTMHVTAPRSGVIFRVLAPNGAAMVKQGTPLAILIPDTNARAVELWVDGNDAPLITAGRHVRIQFEGWPAVQFVGWPSVAVGTFPADVAFVDATDNGNGKFRVVVVPADANDWPSPQYLRQGVRANGWVLLNQVSLGYELWRQFNGFPPVIRGGTSLAETWGKKP